MSSNRSHNRTVASRLFKKNELSIENSNRKVDNTFGSLQGACREFQALNSISLGSNKVNGSNIGRYKEHLGDSVPTELQQFTIEHNQPSTSVFFESKIS